MINAIQAIGGLLLKRGRPRCSDTENRSSGFRGALRVQAHHCANRIYRRQITGGQLPAWQWRYATLSLL
uniref:Uncharacterized protein n=1 Tax=uncultured Rhodospirillales bacterium HF0200_01O14 TaxID=710787 RepID=E0XTU0_9PROT|nr:hypothetical protein [uncultured Rhodospirillales bacterium HF0200_01O14]